MKMVKLASNTKGNTPKVMTKAEQDKLVGLSLNEAFEKGLIKDIGNEKGDFIFSHADENIEAHYAVVNGSAVRVSTSVADDLENIQDYMGDLTFHSGFSKEKYKDGEVDPNGELVPWFRLGKAVGIRLGEAVASIAAEPATQK